MTGGLIDTIRRGLLQYADPDRAAGAKRYLKSDLDFIGVTTPQLRAVLESALATTPPLDRLRLLAAVEGLWSAGPFEFKAAAAELLARHVRLLDAGDIDVVERLLRASRTWALVDALAPSVAGPMVERYPELEATTDRWATDEDFWLRRASLLVHLIPLRRGEGDFARFARYADHMLDEKEFFIRKAIGWVLRETGKKRPELVASWLGPRASRASGVTLREAIKYLPPDLRSTIV